MTREEFVAQLDRGAASLANLPVSSAILRHAASELRKGEPPWWKLAAKAWEKRVFIDWSEAWSLFLTALHFEALNDAECPLIPYFPSCGGTDEADPSPAVAKFLARPTESFFEHLKTGQRRTYVPLRSPIWMAPAALFFHTRGMPYYLVEANAGAGLHLVADRVFPSRLFDSELVAARIGLDVKPLLMEDILHRRWLTAGIYPDSLRSIAELDKAIDLLQARQREEATFIQLVERETATAPQFVAKNVPAEEDVGLLLLNMATTVRMSDADYADYSAAMADTLRPWADRGLWVEIETVRGELYSTTVQVRVHRVRDGLLRSAVLAILDLEARKVVHPPEGHAFLFDGLPKPKKRPFLQFPGFTA